MFTRVALLNAIQIDMRRGMGGCSLPPQPVLRCTLKWQKEEVTASFLCQCFGSTSIDFHYCSFWRARNNAGQVSTVEHDV